MRAVVGVATRDGYQGEGRPPEILESDRLTTPRRLVEEVRP